MFEQCEKYSQHIHGDVEEFGFGINGFVNNLRRETETVDVDEITLFNLLSLPKNFRQTDIVFGKASFQESIYSVQIVFGIMMGTCPVVAAAMRNDGQKHLMSVYAGSKNTIDHLIDGSVPADDHQVTVTFLAQSLRGIHSRMAAISLMQLIADIILVEFGSDICPMLQAFMVLGVGIEYDLPVKISYIDIIQRHSFKIWQI